MPLPWLTMAGRVLMAGAALGFLVGAILTNLNLAILHVDENRTLGAGCEHAEATLAGGPAGLLTGLAAAACFSLLRRRRHPPGLSVLGAVTGALTALLLFTFLLHPFATNHLPVLICSS